MSLARWWSRMFFEERPSVTLAMFRLAVAFTIAAHVVPSLLQMQDNYLPGAFRIKNLWFFPVRILAVVDQSPAWLVWTMAAAFGMALTGFALGWRTQLSAIALKVCCDYFYALNSLHIGTLSFDILLVTLFLMCLTPYPGDAFSLDSRGRPHPWRRLRPVWLLRLLQLQLAWTFWYTAVSKCTAGGNWLTGTPYYNLLHYPPYGVVKAFPGRAWLAGQPEVCDWLGIALIATELLLPLLWFVPRTRAAGIGIGIAFQIMLWATLHVPTIFLFLFPPMMLLFIEPESVASWLDRRAERTRLQRRAGSANSCA